MKRPEAPILPMADAGTGKFSEWYYARRFQREAGPILVKGDDWFVYDGKCWRPRIKHTLAPLSMDVLPQRHQRVRHSRAIMDHVECARQCTAEMEFRSAVVRDGDSILVNVNNGVLRVTAERVALEPHAEALMFTGCLGANWRGLVETPLFTKILREALHDSEDIELFQWFAGYCLYPDCKQHEVCLVCYGPSGTGKSTLADAIVSVFSDDVLVTRLSLAQICTNGSGSYSLPKLQHALVNLGTELNTAEMGESTNFKQIVSEEPIVVRSIYGKPFKMQTTCKLWFLSNSLPRFKGGTDAEYRRVRFLSFSKKPTEKDTALKDKLRHERDGILGWMVGGLQAILRGTPAPLGGRQSAKVLKSFELSNDPVACFVREHCVLSPELETTKDHVMNSFNDFLESHQFPPRKKEYFLRALYERHPSIGVRRDRTGGATKHVLMGIALK